MSAETPVKVTAQKPQWFEEKFTPSRVSREDGNAEAEVAEDEAADRTGADAIPLVKKRPTTSSLSEPKSSSASQRREKSQSSNTGASFAEAGERRELSTHSYSASAATYRRHDKLAASTNALLELLLRHQRTPQLEYVEEDELALRLALHTLRDQCVSANKRALEKETALAMASPRPGGAAPPFLTSGESVELHCSLAVIFANSLCFEEQPETLSVQALSRLLDRFRTAEAAGDVALFQRVIVEAVNEILLYTPLDLEPHLHHAEPSIQRERDAVAATSTPSRQRPAEGSGDISAMSCERPSANLRETELNFFSVRGDDDDDVVGSGGGVAIRADRCAPWRDLFLNGYVSYLQQQGLIAGAGVDSAPHIVLPCDRWFSAATAYEQFVQLLVALFFSRGADLLNHTARVYKLVQFFDLHTAWAASVETPARPMDIVGMDVVAEGGSRTPEPVAEVAAEVSAEAEEPPAAPEAALESEPAAVEPAAEAVVQADEKDEEHPEEDEEHDEMQEVEEAEADTEDEPEDKIEEYKRQQKQLQERHTGVIYYFHSAENSPHRASRSRSRGHDVEEAPPTAAPPAPAGVTAVELESGEQKRLERRHKCYAAGEAPAHHEAKKRIVVENVATEEDEEEEEAEVETVPVTRVEGGALQLPEGNVHKSRLKEL